MAGPKALSGIDTLKIPAAAARDLEQFLKKVVAMYGDDLVSIIAFGSTVTGDFAEASSDVNLLVVYSDLNIVDLHAVADLARQWLRKRKFAPRFLSRRNLLASARYFQIDMLEMKDAHVVLCGEDLLAGISVSRADLHWQLAHEIKAMRMRIKQQFWRTSGDPARMRAVLLERFTSLVHLARALLHLHGTDTPTTHRLVMETACERLGADRGFVDTMFALRASPGFIDREGLLKAFDGMVALIRVVDDAVDKVQV